MARVWQQAQTGGLDSSRGCALELGHGRGVDMQVISLSPVAQGETDVAHWPLDLELANRPGDVVVCSFLEAKQ